MIRQSFVTDNLLRDADRVQCACLPYPPTPANILKFIKQGRGCVFIGVDRKTAEAIHHCRDCRQETRYPYHHQIPA